MLVRPSIRLSTLPPALSLEARLRLAAAIGFEGIEVEVASASPALLGVAADRAGLLIHSVSCRANYSSPLSSPDPAIVAAGIKATIATLEAAKALGADTMLLIPGVVAADASYGEVYARSQEVIRREIVPVAEGLGIVLAVENVWNGFLLSPIDFGQYIDGFDSPWVRAYLDLGNIIFGRPEGWIDLLGPRICKLHLKDGSFDFASGRHRAARIGTGDIDWPRVRAALERIGYSGWGVLAEPEQAQSALMGRLHGKAMSMSAARALPGSGAMLGAAQTFLTRRLLEDVIARFRRHIAA